MRIAPRKDLDGLKADALARLDQAHAARRPTSINDALYAAKRAAALHVMSGGSSALVATVDDALAILDKADEADRQLAALEIERQSGQAAIRAATDWFELQAAIERHIG